MRGLWVLRRNLDDFIDFYQFKIINLLNGCRLNPILYLLMDYIGLLIYNLVGEKLKKHYRNTYKLAFSIKGIRKRG